MAERPHESFQKQPKFTELNDLVAEKVGGKILFSTDDWFAVADNLLKAGPAEWREGAFTEFGKWMDGWESRRKRIEGHDWCIIKLGVPGMIYGVDIDTSFFTGNYAPRASIQAACLTSDVPGRKEAKMGSAASPADFKMVERLNSDKWEFIVPLSPLQPGYKTSCHNYFPCAADKRFTHLRLNMYPDGGIARLRVYGRAVPDWSSISTSQVVDLVAMENGGICIGYSDVHFGHARNLIQPGRAETMADGWETARKVTRPAVLQADKQGILQVPGSDWCVFRLGHPGIVKNIEIDTNHFKGNYPDSCQIEACYVDEKEESQILTSKDSKWKTLLSPTKLKAHNRLFLGSSAINNVGVVSHVRLTMAPDGGISRMRLWGTKANPHLAKL